MKCLCYKPIKYCSMCSHWICIYCDIGWYDPDYLQSSDYICKDCFNYTFGAYKEV